MKNIKKLLFVIEAMGGGIYTYILDLANELIEIYDIYIAYAIRPQTPVNYKEQFDSRIKLISVKNFTRSINLPKDIKAFFEIKKIADEISPDIIHLHSSKAGILGRWAFNGKRIAMFYTPHGYSFLMSNYGFLQRLTFKTIELVSARRSCTTISCSKGEHIETLKFTKRAKYVNNGINIQKLQFLIDSVQSTPNKQFTVFTLGRICYQKNPKLFNEIALGLPSVNFLWIGDGELRNVLTAPNIKITGWVDRLAALQYAMSSDIFLLTSLWEGLPMSLLEAMYMRKLCIVSNVIGNRDVIHNNENGLVCDNIDDYINAISIAQKDKKTRFINKAYKDILQHYNTKIMAEKYQKIYRGTI